MKLSDLAPKTFLNEDGANENSYVIVNYATTNNANSQVTYRASIDEFGKMVQANQNIIKIKTNDNCNGLYRISSSLEANTPTEQNNEEEPETDPNPNSNLEEEESEEENNTPVQSENYAPVKVGEFITEDDRSMMNNALLDISYNTSNYKIIKRNRNATLGYNNETPYTDTDVITLTPSLNSTASTNSAAQQLSISLASYTSSNISLNTATTSAYGVTKLSSSTNSNAEDVAATPKAIKDAIEALNNQKGAANGVATLDENKKVPAAQLPSYVDDVLEYANTTVFPQTGESGKIYVALDTNLTYRWSGSTYTEISQSLALGETSSTAYAGDKGAAAYAAAITNVESSPSNGSTNLITSGAVYTAVNTKYTKPGTGIPATDLEETYLTSFTETDPTVPAWAKESTKPTYTADEVGAISMPTLPLEDGTYTLQVVISDGTPTYSWISQA